MVVVIKKPRIYRFLSWGLDVQSTWLLVMAGLGMIEPLDAAIVGDTQWERKYTRKTFEFYKGWAEDHDIPVEVVTAGNIRKLGADEMVNVIHERDDLLTQVKSLRVLLGVEIAKLARTNLLMIDMLEALKVAKAYIEYIAYEYDEDGKPNNVYRQIVAAIGKAEGKHET